MATDLKIDVFAYDIFSNMFVIASKFSPSVYQIYKDEFCKVESYMEVFNMMFYEAVLCRATIFKTIFSKELTAESIKSLKSVSDCYDYVIQTCDRIDLFEHLSVFERMFSTIAFVLSLCLRVHYDTKNNINILNHAHLLWAMYFDKFTESFYDAGGWKKLKRVASSYFALYSFINLLTECNNLNAIKESLVNYEQFKKSSTFHKSKHVSKQWAKFSINKFESHITIPLYYGNSINAYEAELLLEDLKRLCDPNLKLSNEIFERYMALKSFKGIKANDNDSLAIEHIVSEQKDISSDAYFHECSNDSEEFENTSQSGCHFSNLKVPFNHIDNSINLNPRVNSFKENNDGKVTSVFSADHLRNSRNSIPAKTVNLRLGTKIENFPEKKLHLDHSSENKSLNIQSEEFPTEKLSSETIEIQDDIVSEVNLSGRRRKTNNVPLKCFKPINETININGKTRDIGKYIDEAVSRSKTSAIHQMAVSEKNQNTSLKHISSEKPFEPISKWENTIYDSAKTSKDTDDLRNENDDCRLDGLLRMLLVLGDRQGIEYVRSTLYNSKGMQENATKQMKRRRKKKKLSRI